MFLSLIRWLWFLNPYLLYLFPVVLFITLGKRIRIRILLYCMVSTYVTITSLCMKLGLNLHAALRSPKGILLGKMPFQFPEASSPDHVDS